MPRKLEFNRDEALAAAAEVFWRNGYEATSIDDLTAQLGIGRASLYHSFTDKRNLLDAVVERYQMQARNQLADYLARRGSAPSVIEAMLTDFARIQSGEPQGCMCLNLGLELGEQDEALRRQVLAGLDRVTDTFYALVRRGQAEGDISQAIDSRKLAESLMASVASINALKRLNAPALLLKSVVDGQMSLLSLQGS
jgi:TetR/AcrR family transcriptional regulator, transcriptional repressor for nem operon